MPDVNIDVYDKRLNRRKLKAEAGTTLFQALGDAGIYFDANCGGRGSCGLCRVLVNGRRVKSCSYILREDCKVVLPFSFRQKVHSVVMNSHDLKVPESDSSAPLCVCVDLGTTTIGMVLTSEDHDIFARAGIINSCTKYGSDIASRITFCKDSAGRKAVQQSLLSDLKKGIGSMEDQVKISIPDNIPVYVTGNTAMLHMLCGLDPTSIGEYPFTPERLEFDEFKVPGIGMIICLPCASGYIGSDVTAGAFYHRLHHRSLPTLLIDLGTNGEMILADRNHMLATSTASGPAFERVLKGSEGLRILSDMLHKGYIDSHGTLEDAFAESGIHVSSGDTDVLLTQDDIRSLQLAKAAVRAGTDILCSRFGCEVADVHEVLLAGGFGYFLDVNDAVDTGLLPKEFKDITKTVGNSSLEGCIYCHQYMDELREFNRSILSIDLAAEPAFAGTYIRYMDFDNH